ncbi:MAG TPA: MFS transporter [Aquificaceae bacterium]|nr:MFS transporter [Aquificaceae bacterium]
MHNRCNPIHLFQLYVRCIWGALPDDSVPLRSGFCGGFDNSVHPSYSLQDIPAGAKEFRYGVFGLGASFAPAIGPTLGGWLTQHLGWNWVFCRSLP